jgi:hypothetical protein
MARFQLLRTDRDERRWGLTVVLGLLGTAIGGIGGGAVLGVSGSVIGGAVGAAVGSYIDNAYILPALFPPDVPQGPRLNDFKFQGGEEGSPMTWAIGKAVRMAGTVIWLGTIDEVEFEEEIGKSGSKGAKVQNFEYFIDAQIGICDNVTEKIEKIWADSKLIYDIIPTDAESGPVIVTDNTIQAAARRKLKVMTIFIPLTPGDASSDQPIGPGTADIDNSPSGYSAGTSTVDIDNFDASNSWRSNHPENNEMFTSAAAGDTTQYRVDSWTATSVTFSPASQVDWPDNTELTFSGAEVVDSFLDITSSNQSVDFGVFSSGLDILLTDFDVSTNNGTHTVISAETDLLVVRSDTPTSEAAGNDKTITQSFEASAGITAETIRPQFGAQITPESDLELILGVGNVPIYSGHTYVWVKRLNLSQFGNRLPNFEFLINQDTTMTLGEAIGAVLERAGFVAGEYSTTGLSETFEGMGLRGIFASSQVLPTVMMAYDLVAQDNQGVLTFKKRTAVTNHILSDAVLGAYAPGNDIPDPVIGSDLRDEDLPKQINVRHLDPERALQGGEQVARSVTHQVDSPIVLDLPLTLSSANARAVAERTLWTGHMNRTRYIVTLPPSEMTILENDTITFNAFNNANTCLVRRMEIGENYLVRAQGLLEDSATSTQDAISEKPFGFPAWGPDGATDPDNPDINVDFPGSVALNVVDFAPIRDEDTSVGGFYFGIANFERGSPWFGAGVFESTDGGTTYTQLELVAREATIGITQTVLPDAKKFVWDYISTVTVFLWHGTLISVTEDECAAGANRILIGGELIGFADATLVSTGVYTISTLIRGLQGTDHMMGTHFIGEEVTLLTNGQDPSALEFEERSVSSKDTVSHFKVVPPGVAVADVDAIEHTHRVATLRPFAPWNVTATKDASNDLTITWQSRSRAITRLLGPGSTPSLDSDITYELVILTGSGGTEVRTITTTTRSATYTGAQQTSDGLTPGNVVWLHIWEVSPRYGRGVAALDVTVGGPGAPTEV